jgi:hypothetical protein
MGAATAPKGVDNVRAAIDAEEAADDTRSRATEHPDAKGKAPAENLPDGLELDAGGQLSLEVGGKRPTAATLTLTGGKVTLPKGQFAKGDRIALRVEAVVRGVKLQDQVDSKTQQVVGCERQHFAPISTVTLMSGEQARARVLAILAERGLEASEELAEQLANAALGL